MKRLCNVLLCLCLLAGLCGCAIKLAPDENDPYSIIAADIINGLIDDDRLDGLNDTFYALYDIDGNGIEELLMGNGRGVYGKFLYDMYTIQDGIAVKQDFWADSDEQPSPVILENGTIRSERNDQGELYYYYHRFVDGKLKLQLMLIDNTYYNENEYFYFYDFIGRTPTTKDEFNRMRAEMEGDGQVVKLKWKPLRKYGR